MPTFRYLATDAGAQRRGELTADTDRQVRAALRRMGLTPLRVRRLREQETARDRDVLGLRRWSANLLRDRRRSALAELYESLSALLATGTPLAEALGLLAGAGSATGRLCRTLAERIRSGDGLAEAMAALPEWFSAADAALVRSAERGGEAERALSELAAHHGRADQVRGRLAMALAYPTLLLVFGVGVVIFLTTTTLPQLAGVLADAGVALPPATAFLMRAGSVVREHWPLVLALGLPAGAAAAWLLAGPALARARLRVPLLGLIIRRSQLGAASGLLSRLLRGGVPLDEALGLTAPTVRNRALRDGLVALREEIRSGRETAEAMSRLGVFEPVFVRVVEVGHASGELPEALETIGARYRASSARLVDRLASMLEPAAILVLAGMIGYVVYAAVAPMLRLTQAI